MAQSDRIAEHKNIAENRQARHNYHILEHWEAGIALTGGEVKSLRDGQAQLKDSYALVRDGQAVLLNCHISPYKNAGYATHEPDRTRRLLLHKAEIERIEGKTREKGLTLIPLRLYWKTGKVKCEVALAKGKQLYDKRETERQREADRSARQALKERTRR
ncbi:MAG TPA: SsrA-binding protein SmpB [Terriglobales bacterium]|nr:SsrA-binding protein SmpB [Terriglobales bacterium]